MGLQRQAKILSTTQQKAVLNHITETRSPERNKAIFLLSFKAGLRAKEISGVKWLMVCDPEGNVADTIHLEDIVSKGCSGGAIPMNKELKAALEMLKSHEPERLPTDTVIRSERSEQTSAQAIVNKFRDWYSALGYEGCSSHSGRRTFITRVARRISTVNGSARDVQKLARHSNLNTTMRYIDADPGAMRKVVALI
ncbi:MAG: site-specific integrase [Alphaproteobacteria bacterium]|jgi:integrase|nr:site-specific integrase [Alphaproteobacteria bacterium]MBT4542543.1 site-specific integrase [Alphaproteobacteria bacterium]MBT7743748.1 site-specific integrase [Alphaproteobacteria bacterium]